MRIVSLIGRNFRGGRYRLRSLLALVTVVCVVLAVWTERERQYRARIAAVAVLDRYGTVGVEVPDGMHPAGRQVHARPSSLRRADVVTNLRLWTFSEETMSAMASFPTLRVLDFQWPDYFHGSGITDAQIRQVARLPLIERLYLDGTQVGDDGARNLRNLRFMRVLGLGGTRITDAALENLTAMPRLETLDLRETRVTDDGVRRLAAITSLRELNLRGTRITAAALPYISRLRGLENLDLHGTAIDDGALRHLANLPRLVTLSLGATRVSDAGLRNLPKLESLWLLDLEGCAISDAGLAPLAEFKALTYVYLYNTALVTASGAAKLKQMRPDLSITGKHFWDQESGEWKFAEGDMYNY